MLVTETLFAELEVSEEVLTRPGAMEGIGSQLARRVVALADERAGKVRTESISIFRVGADSKRGTVRFRAAWSPREARFLGGEYDGDTSRVARESDGLPPELLTMPYRDAPSAIDSVLSAPWNVGQHPRYRRAGIDPIDDVWVYEHIR